MTGIVVGVDGSEGAATALRWAVEEGRIRGWPVTAVAAWALLDQRHVEPDAPFDPDYGADDAAAALAAHVSDALGPDRSALVSRRTVNDLPATALLQAAEGADLLVVGARGLGGFKGLLLGSVSQHCLHHAPCPVAVVRSVDGERADGPGRVVVGTDGSPRALVGLTWAAREAAARGATLEVVHAWHPPYFGAYPFPAGVIDVPELERSAATTLRNAVASIDISGLARPVATRLVTGGAAEALLEAAEGADLVVVASRGFGGFASLVLGSVSDQVTRHAPCPVVVVPAGD